MNPFSSIGRLVLLNRPQAAHLMRASLKHAAICLAMVFVLQRLADMIHTAQHGPNSRIFVPTGPAAFLQSVWSMLIIAIFMYVVFAIVYLIKYLRTPTSSTSFLNTPELRIDHKGMAGTLFWLWFRLCLCSVAAVFLVALLFALLALGGLGTFAGPIAFLTVLPLAITTIMATMLITVAIGAVIVPVWGTILGLIGTASSTDSALRATDGTKVFAETDQLVRDVAELSARLGLPHIPMAATIPMANAYAIGDDLKTSIVAVGTPLLETMPREQVRAIIGHELGHLISRDSTRKYFAQCFQNSLVWFLGFRGLKRVGRRILLFLGELTFLALSRRREYWADAVGAALTSKEAMIGALRAVESMPDTPPDAARDFQALMFFDRWSFKSIWSTHPSFSSRIRALETEKYIRLLPVSGWVSPRGPAVDLSWDSLPTHASSSINAAPAPAYAAALHSSDDTASAPAPEQFKQVADDHHVRPKPDDAPRATRESALASIASDISNSKVAGNASMWRGIAVLVAAVGGIGFYTYTSGQETRHEIQIKNATATALGQGQSRITQLEAEIQQHRQTIDNLRREALAARQNAANQERENLSRQIQQLNSKLMTLEQVIIQLRKERDDAIETSNRNSPSEIMPDRSAEIASLNRQIVELRRLSNLFRSMVERGGRGCPSGTYLANDGYCYNR